MGEFSGKTIIVSGAAGNLGKAVVKAFLTSGAVVCGLDHREGRLKKAVNPSEFSGSLFCYENVDVTDREGMQSLVARVREDAGVPDVLVNTVGDFTFGEMVYEISMDAWDRMFNKNVFSFLNVAHGFIPDMLEKGPGKVITVGSGSSLKGGAKTGAYSAAKGALLRLTESMAAELAAQNIQVNCVLPGIIDTPENREVNPDADFSKWVKPEKIADVILFLASSASDAITGKGISLL
jgi:NAD(P)-dependent dehydrogenase (short-subunit alcohol dehydrogenase family)